MTISRIAWIVATGIVIAIPGLGSVILLHASVENNDVYLLVSSLFLFVVMVYLGWLTGLKPFRTKD